MAIPARRTANSGVSVLTTLRGIFGCPHRRTTFPRVRKDLGGRPKDPVEHYIVCLDCSREINHTLFDPPKESAKKAAA